MGFLATFMKMTILVYRLLSRAGKEKRFRSDVKVYWIIPPQSDPTPNYSMSRLSRFDRQCCGTETICFLSGSGSGFPEVLAPSNN